MIPVPARRGYLPTLDGWRAIAALWVIAGHAAGTASCEIASPPYWCNVVGSLAGHGVGIFFALSGFLITARLLEERSLRGSVSLRGFYLRRAFRILPAAALYLAVIGLARLAGRIPLRIGEWAAAAFFVRDYVGWVPLGWYTAHFWSLSVEEKFYLVWPLTFGVVIRLGRVRAAAATLALAIGVVFWRIADGHWGITNSLLGLPRWPLNFRWDTRTDALLCGCACALILSDPRFRMRIASYIGGSAQAVMLSIFTAVILLSTVRARPALILESPVAPLLLVSTVLAPSTFLGRVLEHPVLRWIGLRSYGLYLWQQALIGSHTRNDLGVLFRFPLNLVMLLAVTSLSYRYLERPLIRLGHRLAEPTTPGRPDVSR